MSIATNQRRPFMVTLNAAAQFYFTYYYFFGAKK